MISTLTEIDLSLSSHHSVDDVGSFVIDKGGLDEGSVEISVEGLDEGSIDSEGLDEGSVEIVGGDVDGTADVHPIPNCALDS